MRGRPHREQAADIVAGQFASSLHDISPGEANTDLRYEIKLVCDPHMLPQARSWIRLHPAGFRVAYPPRPVNSLYLDTLHLSGLSANLDGLNARQKLRLRWYGDEVKSVQPNLELKQKRNLMGRKIVYPLPCKLDLTWPWAEILRALHTNAGPEWRLLLQTMSQPTLLTRYRREYYVTPDGAIRVTLDWAQVAHDQRLRSHPNLHARLPIPDVVVIEIKTGLEQAEYLPEVVAQFPVLRCRNSKYINGLMVALG